MRQAVRLLSSLTAAACGFLISALLGGCGSGGLGDEHIVDCTPGACIIEVNNDCTTGTGGYPCCFEVGGENECAEALDCPEVDGGCILYASEAVEIGSCCYREDGASLDEPEICEALLDATHAESLECLDGQ